MMLLTHKPLTRLLKRNSSLNVIVDGMEKGHNIYLKGRSSSLTKMAFSYCDDVVGIYTQQFTC